jgi:hypothetical protein
LLDICFFWLFFWSSSWNTFEFELIFFIETTWWFTFQLLRKRQSFFSLNIFLDKLILIFTKIIISIQFRLSFVNQAFFQWTYFDLFWSNMIVFFEIICLCFFNCLLAFCVPELNCQTLCFRILNWFLKFI